MRTAPRHRLHLYHLWIALAAIGFCVGLVAAWGEWRGWWKDAGEALGLASLLFTVGFGLLGASGAAIRQIGGRLDAILDLLEERLPR
jgi:hypothetical protein